MNSFTDWLIGGGVFVLVVTYCTWRHENRLRRETEPLRRMFQRSESGALSTQEESK